MKERLSQICGNAALTEGLDAHFMLRIAQLLRPADAWCLVTAAEWLDNGYGSAIRQLVCAPDGMGLKSRMATMRA